MKIAIIGVGNLGKAILFGLKKTHGANVDVAAWDKVPAALQGLAENGVMVAEPALWDAQNFTPNAVIVAVKPCDVAETLVQVNSAVKPLLPQPLIISVAAGININTIQEKLNGRARVCRVMPNTPALIGEGMSAYALSENCTEDDAQIVEKIFGACGKVMRVDEKLMDAITGLSGSGPAFVYSFIEALAEGGVSAGLSYQTAVAAAAQTVVGAAKMVLETGEHPSVLRSKVMSPGGTTVAGLQALERGAFKGAVMAAVTEAAERSKNMF